MESYADGTEIVRVYLAITLDEARTAENVLSRAGVDYAVEVEAFASPTALGSGSERSGAGFWVDGGLLESAADALQRAGCVAGLVDRGR